MLIRSFQQAAMGSILGGRDRTSQEPAAISATVCQRGCLHEVPDGMPLARRLSASEVQADVCVWLGRPPLQAVRLLPLSGLGDGRDDTPQFVDPAHDVVVGGVSDDDG